MHPPTVPGPAAGRGRPAGPAQPFGPTQPPGPHRRDLATLPKAHLHLHLTGSMRRATLVELARARGRGLPGGLSDSAPLAAASVAAPGGWFRFQHAYDLARSVLTGARDLDRVLREAAEDARAEGVGWLEVQVDPTGYAHLFGGLVGALEAVVASALAAEAASGVGVGIVVAANRTRHPLEARTLARLAVRGARAHPGRVVGFGLSNDERRGRLADFAPAFAIAGRAGLLRVPHAGELLGAEAVREAVLLCGAERLGHGVRAAEEPEVLRLLARRGVTCEVCPVSNVALGVAGSLAEVPLRVLLEAGVPVALGADDPLLFGAGLVEQYQVARDVHGLDEAALAELARCSVRASAAPPGVRARLLAGIDAWLAAPAPTP